MNNQTTGTPVSECSLTTPVLHTQAADFCYWPAYDKSLYQVKEGINILNALLEAKTMLITVQSMLNNYCDHEGAINMAGYALPMVEGLLDAVQSALESAGFKGEDLSNE